MTALANPQPEPRSGDASLTRVQRELPTRAAGWMAFFRFVVKLHAEVREKSGGRAYLDYPEWNKFFKAAVKYGCLTRAEIAGEIMPLETYSALHPRANRHLGSLLHAALIETYRQVREAKARGDSAWHFARWQTERCAAYDVSEAERMRATAQQRQASTVVSSLKDRKSRRRRDVDDVDEE